MGNRARKAHRSMDIALTFKGKTSSVYLGADSSTDAVFEAARQLFSLEDQNLKILAKGKALLLSQPIASTALVAGVKCMVMATGKREVDAVLSAKSDPTVRSFESEDAMAKKHLASSDPRGDKEFSEWGHAQHPEYRFCRFEPCTWQSFGTRPSSTTPHAFEARALMLKLAQDPAITTIMTQREWTVGLLAELDPIDDRHAEKMEGEGKRLLGYNTNAGMSIHIRLRTEDLSGFLPYPSLIDTLLHELCHNEVGPHNETFWALFCQLKADYLRTLMKHAHRGELFNGKSSLQLADAVEEAKDVRSACLAALERDRQMPAGPLQPNLLDAYLAASVGDLAGAMGQLVGEGGAGGGGASVADGQPSGEPLSQEQRRKLLADRAARGTAGGSRRIPSHANDHEPR